MFDGRFAPTRKDWRRDYGEKRFDMRVQFNGVVLNVSFTPRGAKQGIISARLANRKEGRFFDGRQQNG